MSLLKPWPLLVSLGTRYADLPGLLALIYEVHDQATPTNCPGDFLISLTFKITKVKVNIIVDVHQRLDKYIKSLRLKLRKINL